jgi:hypothetical protein
VQSLGNALTYNPQMRPFVVAIAVLIACGRVSFDRHRRDAGTGDAASDATVIDAMTIDAGCPYAAMCAAADQTTCCTGSDVTCTTSPTTCAGSATACDHVTNAGCGSGFACCIAPPTNVPQCYGPIMSPC